MQITVGFSRSELAEALHGWASRISDLTPYWEVVADPMVRGWYEDVFRTEGGVLGQTWAPLTAATLAMKARRGRAGMGTLRDSGTMYRSLTVRGDPNQLAAKTPSSFIFGTLATNDGFPYPLVQQRGWVMSSIFGRPVKPRAVPARPFSPSATLPESWASALRTSIVEYVTHGLS